MLRIIRYFKFISTGVIFWCANYSSIKQKIKYCGFSRNIHQNYTNRIFSYSIYKRIWCISISIITIILITISIFIYINISFQIFIIDLSGITNYFTNFIFSNSSIIGPFCFDFTSNTISYFISPSIKFNILPISNISTSREASIFLSFTIRKQKYAARREGLIWSKFFNILSIN